MTALPAFVRRHPLAVAVLALVLLAGGVVTARVVEGVPRHVTVLGPWTGAEQRHFEELLDEVAGDEFDVDYQGTTAEREVLLSQLQTGTPPDIVILPSVGELAEYVREGHVRALPRDIVDEIVREGPGESPWQPSVDLSGKELPHGVSVPAPGAVHWVPLKAALKSIVWHRPGDATRARAADPASWCLGMRSGDASGWPGTDWIEDILLQRKDGITAYTSWANGRAEWTQGPVAEAWREWVDLLRKDRAVARGALGTAYTGTGGGLLAEGRGGCVLEHQGSFARSFYTPGEAEELRVGESAPLLPGDGVQRAREVSADFAAVFTGTEAAYEVLRRLVGAEAQRSWAAAGGVPSIHPDVGAAHDPVSETLRRLLTGRDLPRCLDASDVMPPVVRDAFYEAVLRELDDPGAQTARLLNGIEQVQAARRDAHPWLAGVCSTPQ